MQGCISVCIKFYSTILVEPGCTAEITKYGDVLINVGICTCINIYMCVILSFPEYILGNTECSKPGQYWVGCYPAVCVLTSIHEHCRTNGQVRITKMLNLLKGNKCKNDSTDAPCEQ